MLAVEAVRVHVDHLKESAWEKFIREKAPQTAEHLVFGTSASDQRYELHAVCEVGAAEKILVAVRHCAEILARAEYLDVRFRSEEHTPVTVKSRMPSSA